MQDTLEAEPKVLLDPNSLSEDGTVSLRANSWSHDGSVLAYGLSKSGSDWTTIKFKNVETGEDFDEELEKVKFSGITWTHDNKGVFYGCYPEHDLSCATGKDTKSHGKSSKQKVDHASAEPFGFRSYFFLYPLTFMPFTRNLINSMASIVTTKYILVTNSFIPQSIKSCTTTGWGLSRRRTYFVWSSSKIPSG